MLRNYFKVMTRLFARQRSFVFINLFGLSTSLAACLLIGLYVFHELSYDRFHENADRIYRLTPTVHYTNGTSNQRAVSSPPMSIILHNDFPEIEKTMKLSNSSRTLSSGDKVFYNVDLATADSSFFDIFSFPLLYGDPATALLHPNSIVVTEDMATKYFGTSDVLNKTLTLSDTIPLQITGVVKKLKDNSHFRFEAIYSRSTLVRASEEPADDWFYNNFYTYVLLAPNTDVQALTSKFPAMLDRHMGADRKKGPWYELDLTPVADIHLHSNVRAEIQPNSSMQGVLVFASIGLLILFIAYSNFMSLTTASSSQRSREVGIRKATGAVRGQLIRQFLGESVFLSIISLAIGFIIAHSALPYFSSLVDREMTFNFIGAAWLFIGFAIIGVVGGLFAGLYPSIILSGFKAVDVLKGRFGYKRGGAPVRQALVVIQFSITVFLICGTLVVNKQLNLVRSAKLGFDKEQVMIVNIHNFSGADRATLRQQFQDDPSIVNATLSSSVPGRPVGRIATVPDGFTFEELISVNTIIADERFLKTYDIQVVTGREFIPSSQEDVDHSFMVNESAVKFFQWKSNEEAIGKSIDWGTGKIGKVIAVVKDFHYESLRQSIEPLILHQEPEDYDYLSLRVAKANDISGMEKNIAALETRWKTMTDAPFEYSFLNDDLQTQYKAELSLERFFYLFSGLAIVIACLGLFGLVAFTADQRRKEIGIRKVLGGSTGGVVWLLSSDYIKLVIISNLIGLPLAMWAVRKWLASFAFQVDGYYETFVLAAVISLAIAGLTVCFQSFKAAIANPIQSIRIE